MGESGLNAGLPPQSVSNRRSSLLLALLAVGLLSLSTVATRSSGRVVAQSEAQANARLALQLAIAELQETLGDDRRITADASILIDSKRPHAVGVWESWSPRMIDQPEVSAANYDREKTTRFRRWLTSGDVEERSELDWAKSLLSNDNSVELFQEAVDGFSIRAESININSSDRQGTMAWAVSQEATKAKITVPGLEADARLVNDEIQLWDL